MNYEEMMVNGEAAHARIAATGATAHPRVTTNGDSFLIDGVTADPEEVRALVFGADYTPPPEWPEADRWGLGEFYNKGYGWTYADKRVVMASDDADIAEAVRRWRIRDRQCLACALGLPDIHSATRAGWSSRGLRF